MDFDLFEELTEEDIKNLYDDIVITQGNLLSSTCYQSGTCTTTDGLNGRCGTTGGGLNLKCSEASKISDLYRADLDDCTRWAGTWCAVGKNSCFVPDSTSRYGYVYKTISSFTPTDIRVSGEVYCYVYLSDPCSWARDQASQRVYYTAISVWKENCQ